MGNILSVVVTVLGLKKSLPSINDSSLITMILSIYLATPLAVPYMAYPGHGV